jgi:arylsulfatase A-like enzyme
MTKFLPHKLLLLLSCVFLLMSCGQADPVEDNSAQSVSIQNEALQNESLQNELGASKRPNFLLITTDDMGYTDIGAFGGNDIPTPNLDKLALEGLRLTNFHVSVSCAPTRSMLMSGTGNHEAGMGSQQRYAAFQDQPGYERYLTDRVASLPERMQAAGYHTYMAGKWHLGNTPGSTLPGDRGFERSFALMPGSAHHFKLADDMPPALYNGRVSLRVPYSEDGQILDDLPDDFYSTTAYVDKMLEYLKSSESSEQPFFAWFAPTAPHWPLQVLPEWMETFRGAYDAGYDALCAERQQGAINAGVAPDNADYSRCPEEAVPWSELSEEDRQLNRRTMELYASMVAHLDAEFGRIITYLEQSGQLENTYIIYHNDNGPQGGPTFDLRRSEGDHFDNSLENLGNPNTWVNVGQGWSDAQSAPFREDKGSSFEGGTRTAAFIRPLNPEELERTSSSLIMVMDIMPTVMDLAGIQESEFNSNNPDLLPIRGKSFAALLDNPSQAIHSAEEPIALDHAGLSWLHQGDWKITRGAANDDNWQLFNIKDDPSETRELSTEHPELLAELVAVYDDHAQATGILRREPPTP